MHLITVCTDSETAQSFSHWKTFTHRFNIVCIVVRMMIIVERGLDGHNWHKMLEKNGEPNVSICR